MRNKVCFIITEDAENCDNGKLIGKIFLDRYQKNCQDKDITFVVNYPFKEDLPKEEELTEYLGFVISGSQYSVNDELPWMLQLEEFIKKLYHLKGKDKPKLFGTCFGHQLITKAFGGYVGYNPNEKFFFGSELVTVDDKLRNKKFFSKVFSEKRNTFRIMEAHGEQVIKLPSIATCVGKSKSCKYEILMYGDFILSTQGHPEFTLDFMDKILPEIKENLNESQIEIMDENLKLVDGDIMVKLVLEFLYA